MSVIQWWDSLSLVTQIFYCIALPSTLVLLLQTVLMFVGIGSDSDGDFSLDHSVGDVESSDLPELHEGIFGDPDSFDPSDAAGLEDLRIFSVRGIVAFLVVFGWVGGLVSGLGASLLVALPVALLCGVVTMVLLAFLMRAIMRLRSDGNTDNRNAIGTSGKVHLTIPPQRTGEGKVHLLLQGALVEREAVTDEVDAIPTGSEIVVTKISGQTTLVVKRK